MKLFESTKKDIFFARRFLNVSTFAIFFNRGFRALLFYRIANRFYKWKVPGLPLIFTRIIQILYAIDIDYKANLSGGIVIVHGVGLVIGSGAVIDSDVVLFHGVTLGRRGIGPVISSTDGFPTIEKGCIICAGAKLLGNIVIKENTTIGANAVVTDSIGPNVIYKIPNSNFVTYNK
jgi:serine O-acetyltransferase